MNIYNAFAFILLSASISQINAMGKETDDIQAVVKATSIEHLTSLITGKLFVSVGYTEEADSARVEAELAKKSEKVIGLMVLANITQLKLNPNKIDGTTEPLPRIVHYYCAKQTYSESLK